MSAKKKPAIKPPKRTKPAPSVELSKTEEDLLRHMNSGYQLQTSSLWDNPILRNLKNNTEVRSTANRGTIETLQKRGLIAVAEEGGVVSPTVWRLVTKAAK